MNFLSKLIVLLAIATMSWSCDNFLPPIGPTLPPTPLPVSIISIADVVSETNNQRKLNGTAPLFENAKLNAVADYKMRDMFVRQYFNHRAPDDTSDIEELLPKFGYQYYFAGENLAMGDFKNAVEIVALWMNSPGHRANILDERFKEIGVAVGEDVFSGRRTKIAVQIFGTLR